MLASSLTASLVLRICRSCMSFCEMTVTAAGVCSSGASLKPPTATRLAAGALLAVTTTSAMFCVSLAALSLSAANAGAANACRMARVRTETDTFKDEFGVGIDGSWYGSAACSAGANAGAIKGGRYFALSFAGIIQIRYEGYLSPEKRSCRFQDP